MSGSIAKRDNGSWRARYRDARGREHSRSFARKADGQAWLNEITTARSTGRYVDPGKSRLTVGAWSQTWLAGQAHLKPTTRVKYESLLRNQVLPTWEEVRLADVAHGDVVAWVAGLTDKGLAPATVAQAHRVLSLVLSLAVRDGRVATNAADHVRLPRPRPKVQRFLTFEEVLDLADAAGPDGGLVVRFLALTGLRFGEMAALRVGSLDLLRRRVMVSENVVAVHGRPVFGSPKSHQARSVPMPASLAEELAAHVVGKGLEDLVFTSPKGSVLSLANWRPRCWDPAVKRAGLAPLTPHDLRHTAASLAVASGASVKSVQRMLGHASAAMTLDVYAGLFDDELDAVADRLESLGSAARAARLRPNEVVVPLARDAT